MRGKWVVAGGAAAVVAVLVLAWSDGGREPVHAIAVPVAMPGAAQ